MEWLKRQFEKMKANNHLDDAFVALVSEKYGLSIDHSIKALQFYEATPDAAGTCRCLNILADGYLGAKDLSLAEQTYQKSSELLDGNSRKSDFQVVAAQTGLGEVQRFLGNYSGAEEHYRCALRIMDELRINDQRVPEWAQTLNGLACVLAQKCEYDEAEKLFERAFKMVEYPPKGWGILHTLSGSVCKNYSELLRTIGKSEQAEKLDLHAAAISARRA
jgi:tetratricopeptide (TPR) repeat protein